MEVTIATNNEFLKFEDTFSGNNSTTELWNNSSTDSPPAAPQRNESLAKVEVAIQTLIFTMAIIGNTTVVLILLKMSRRKKKLSRMNVLIFHLSIADLFVAFFNVLPQLIWDVTQTFYGGDFLCRSVKYFQIVAMYASSYVLLTTAVDRYFALCHPFISQRWSNGRVHIMVGIAWALSLIFSIPQVFIFSYTEVIPGYYQCWATFNPFWTLKLYVTLFTAAIFIVPTLVLILAYGKICYVVWKTNNRQEQSFKLKHSKESVSNGHHCNGELTKLTGVKKGPSEAPRVHVRRPKLNRSKFKTIKLTCVVVVCYVVCWSPFFISQMWAAWDENAPFEATAMVIIMLLASLNSCTNPWIYLAFTDNLRRHLLLLFPCRHTRARSFPSAAYTSSIYSKTELSRIESSAIDKDSGIQLVKL